MGYLTNKPLQTLIHDGVNADNSIIAALEYIHAGRASEEEVIFLHNKMLENARNVNAAIDAYYTSQLLASATIESPKAPHSRPKPQKTAKK